jgi:hypothetical protein
MLFVAPPRRMGGRGGPFYAGLFGGYVMPDDLENGSNVSLDSSWALGVKGGYIIPTVKWFAVEMEFAYLAEQDIDQAGAFGDFGKQPDVQLYLPVPRGKFILMRVSVSAGRGES